MRSFVLALVVGAGILTAQAAQPTPASRIVLVGTAVHPYGLIEGLAISPNGTSIAWIAGDDDEPEVTGVSSEYIWVKNDAHPASRIAGGKLRLGNLQFTPDGKALSFWVEGRGFSQVPAVGGRPKPLRRLPADSDLEWSANGDMVVTKGRTRGPIVDADVPAGPAILLFPSAGGRPQTLVRFGADETVSDAQLLPDKNAVVFASSTRLGAVSNIYAVRRGATDRTLIVSNASKPRYVRHTHTLVYMVGDKTLIAAPFDPVRLQLTGAPTVLATHVQYSFALSADGMLVFACEQDPRLQVSIVSLDGSRKVLGFLPKAGDLLRVSPDGRLVAFDVERFIPKPIDLKYDLWVAPLDNLNTVHRVVDDTSGEAVWAPDGRDLVFGSPRTNGSIGSIYSQAVEDPQAASLLIRDADQPEFWSTRDRSLWFIRWIGHTPALWKYSERSGASSLITPLQGGTHAALSPDGQLLAFEWMRSDEEDVYVTPNEEGGRAVQALTGASGRLMWAPDGRALFVDRGRQLVEIDVRANGADVTLDQGKTLPMGGYTAIDMMPDGHSFLTLSSVPAELEIVPNALTTRRNIPPDGAASEKSQAPVAASPQVLRTTTVRVRAPATTNDRGSILVSVRNEIGEEFAGATIKAISECTGEEFTATSAAPTNSPILLPSGSYSVKASEPAFREEGVVRLKVEANKQTEVNLSLPLRGQEGGSITNPSTLPPPLKGICRQD